MTIIIALPDPDKGITWLGSDTQCENSNRSADVGAKYIIAHGAALAYSGPLRGLNLIRANPDLLKALKDPVDLTERLRSLLVGDGLQPMADGSEGYSDYHCQLILARAGTCWEISRYFDIVECPPGKLAALGSGMEYALGAAEMLARVGARATLTPDKMMIAILQVAMSLSPNCGGRYHITPLMTKEAKDALEREQRAAAHEEGEQPEKAPPVGANSQQSPAPG